MPQTVDAILDQAATAFVEGEEKIGHLLLEQALACCGPARARQFLTEAGVAQHIIDKIPRPSQVPCT